MFKICPILTYLVRASLCSLLSTTVSNLFILFVRDDEHDFPGYGFVVCGKENATGTIKLLTKGNISILTRLRSAKNNK